MIIEIILAWFYSHIFEYLAHKYVLHNHRIFSFAFKNHFSNHHRIARSNKMYDKAYESIFSSFFEVFSLFLVAILHSPLIFLFPYSYGTLLICLLMYYFIHKKVHTNVSWGEKWIPWHYAHHMGKDQNKNWGVRLPIIDIITKSSHYKK
jgi:hypothetical protein